MTLKKFKDISENKDFKGFQDFMGKVLSGSEEEVKFNHKQKEKTVADIADFKKEVIYISNIEDYDNTDILSSIAELVCRYHLTKDDVKKVLDDENEFEFQKYLGIIYDKMIDDEDTSNYDPTVVNWFSINGIHDYEKAMVSLEKLGLTITKK